MVQQRNVHFIPKLFDIGRKLQITPAGDSVLVEKNMIAIENKNTLFAYGDSAFEMYEKAPGNIHTLTLAVSSRSLLLGVGSPLG